MPEFPDSPFGPSRLPGAPKIPKPELDIDKIYIDMTGGIHVTPEGAISENQRLEGDFFRGASGGCNQDPKKAKP